MIRRLLDTIRNMFGLDADAPGSSMAANGFERRNLAAVSRERIPVAAPSDRWVYEIEVDSWADKRERHMAEKDRHLGKAKGIKRVLKLRRRAASNESRVLGASTIRSRAFRAWTRAQERRERAEDATWRWPGPAIGRRAYIWFKVGFGVGDLVAIAGGFTRAFKETPLNGTLLAASTALSFIASGYVGAEVGRAIQRQRLRNAREAGELEVTEFGHVLMPTGVAWPAKLLVASAGFFMGAAITVGFLRAIGAGTWIGVGMAILTLTIALANAWISFERISLRVDVIGKLIAEEQAAMAAYRVACGSDVLAETAGDFEEINTRGEIVDEEAAGRTEWGHVRRYVIRENNPELFGVGTIDKPVNENRVDLSEIDEFLKAAAEGGVAATGDADEVAPPAVPGSPPDPDRPDHDE